MIRYRELISLLKKLCLLNRQMLVQCVSFRTDFFRFYEVKQGLFDCRQRTFKVLLCPISCYCQTDTFQGFLKRYCMTILAKHLRNCRRSKLAVKKISRPFGFEATLFATLHSKSMLFRRPGFDSRMAQSLTACKSVAPCSGKPYSTSFERSKLYLKV